MGIRFFFFVFFFVFFFFCFLFVFFVCLFVFCFFFCCENKKNIIFFPQRKISFLKTKNKILYIAWACFRSGDCLAHQTEIATLFAWVIKLHLTQVFSPRLKKIRKTLKKKNRFWGLLCKKKNLIWCSVLDGSFQPSG